MAIENGNSKFNGMTYHGHLAAGQLVPDYLGIPNYKINR